MLFERIVSEGIAHISYIIGSGGHAAVIDPRRDCDIYIEIAARNELAISYIFETHRNEDYVSGSLELADRCGADIYHGAQMEFLYGKAVRDGDTFALGALRLTIRETPGHTEESISVIVQDTDVSDHPYLVFCGDTLFAGDIARTDFFGQERKAEMAGKIYDSIEQKILSLGDGVILCPAHGAGSVCGNNIADHPFTTIGYEKISNPQLAIGREAFIALRINESPYVPPYFRQMEHYNRKGAPVLHRSHDIRTLTVTEVIHLKNAGCQIIDIRSPTSFSAGHIPGSFSIWRAGLPAFLGWYIDYQKPIVIVDDFNLSPDSVFRHLFRLGYDKIAGILAEGFSAWSKSAQVTKTLPVCSVQQLHDRLDTESPFLLDVRDIKNWHAIGHIKGAHHIYVGELLQHLDEIPANEPVIVYCDAGFKGSLAASVLELYHYNDLTNVLGGMTAWVRAGFRLER